MPRYRNTGGSRGDGDGGIVLENASITKLCHFGSDGSFGSSSVGEFPFARAGVALIDAVKEYGRNVDAVSRGVDGVYATIAECKLAREAEKKSRKRKNRKRKRTSSTASVESKRDGDDDGLVYLTPVVIKVCFLRY